MALTVVNLTDTFDEWRVKTNTLGTNTGDLTTLSTTAKNTLVAAINELDGEAHITNVVEDTSPQLGGDLVLNSNDITGTGNINTTGGLILTGTVNAAVVASEVFTGGTPSITSTTSNANITITPNGTGDVNLETDKVKLGSSGEDVILTTNGSGTLTIGPNDAGSGMPVIQLENAGRILLNCVSGQPVIIDGDVQATSYTGALNTATTGTTQSASNNSTLIATTAYVDAQVATEDTVAEMNDTTVSSPANLDLLQYNSSTSKWVNTAIGAVVGATQSASNNSTLLATTAYVDAQVATEDTLAEMNDTTISSPQNLDVLQYTGSVWENQVLSAGVSIDDATALAIALG